MDSATCWKTSVSCVRCFMSSEKKVFMRLVFFHLSRCEKSGPCVSPRPLAKNACIELLSRLSLKMYG